MAPIARLPLSRPARHHVNQGIALIGVATVALIAAWRCTGAQRG
jgi:hypothetical protein